MKTSNERYYPSLSELNTKSEHGGEILMHFGTRFHSLGDHKIRSRFCIQTCIHLLVLHPKTSKVQRIQLKVYFRRFKKKALKITFVSKKVKGIS